uniref:Cysteine-rich receptor-like protein kinase n=1 Tax=Tanacetum cinerariifolium TaxID=118510 RepID=A0A699H0I4_TANCI|nr:cysteine-rich receptor-like protein kinase [Tanacetum cinerariifolium]
MGYGRSMEDRCLRSTGRSLETIWIDKYKLRVFKAKDRKDKLDGSKGENGRNGGGAHRPYQRQGVIEHINERDERLYSHVVQKYYNIKKGSDQYEMNSERDGFKEQEEASMIKSARVIEVEQPDEHVNNIMEGSIIGKVKKLEYLEKIHMFLQMEGIENVLVKYNVGGLDIMLVFEKTKTVHNIMMNIDHDIRQWLENTCKGGDYNKRVGRLTWLNIIEVPVAWWCEALFRRIACNEMGCYYRNGKLYRCNWEGDGAYYGNWVDTRRKKVAEVNGNLSGDGAINSDEYKVTHVESSGASSKDKESTEVSSKNLGESVNSDRVRVIGEMLGVVWEKKKSGNIPIQQIDDQWIEDVLGSRNFGYMQVEAKGRPGGLLLVWDSNVFSIGQAAGNDNYLTVKGNWKGKAGDVAFVNVYGPHPASKKGELWNKLEDMINGFKGIIKGDLVSVIQWFWKTGEISRGCNTSFVTLIPKSSDPIGLGDYRPISLIGFYYKIIAKLLAERIKVVMGKLVGEVKNAFVKGRYILDGVLTVNKTVRYIKNARKKCLLLKVDFEKAYDSLNWDFLLEVLKVIWFGSKWRKWVEACLTSASISVLVNGSPTKEFNMGRQVRQGDPLSPFLFILAAEGLNVIMGAVDKGLYRGVWVGDHKLRDRFPRLYYLERCKEAKIVDRGRWIDGEWKLAWEWTWEPRGRGGGELEELESTLHNIIIDSSFRDTYPLSLSFDFVFMSDIFKSLSFSLDRLCHLAISCLDQHAHTLHHLESLLTSPSIDLIS